MDNFANVFGFERNDNTIDIDSTKKYGLAIFCDTPDSDPDDPDDHIRVWRYMKGSWVKLYNFYCGLLCSTDIIEEKFIYAVAFFELDENNTPTAIISKAIKPKKIQQPGGTIRHRAVICDLCWIDNEAEISPMEFEI